MYPELDRDFERMRHISNEDIESSIIPKRRIEGDPYETLRLEESINMKSGVGHGMNANRYASSRRDSPFFENLMNKEQQRESLVTNNRLRKKPMNALDENGRFPREEEEFENDFSTSGKGNEYNMVVTEENDFPVYNSRPNDSEESISFESGRQTIPHTNILLVENKCLQSHEHIKSCPVCSKAYQCDNKVWIISTIFLVSITLFLIKKYNNI